jgi:shikimate kinase
VSEAGTVWLVGMMGSGKSTVGRALALRLGLRFVDTDAEIERACGRSIAEIFAREGEAAFRERERAEIARWCGEAAVVALGGGAIAQEGLAARLAATGTVVYLRARPETLRDRAGDDDSRPLLRGLDAEARLARLASLLEERRAAYETATLALDTDDLSPEQVASGLAARLSARASA